LLARYGSRAAGSPSKYTKLDTPPAAREPYLAYFTAITGE